MASAFLSFFTSILWTVKLFVLGSSQIPDPVLEPDSDYFPTARGELLHGVYRVHHKLGAGVYSTIWLVSDTERRIGYKRPTRFYAAKILNGEASQLHVTGEMLEQEALLCVAQCEDINCLPVLRDQFLLRTRNGREHHCFILDLLGPSLSTVRLRTPTKALPYYTVRNILAQVLEGLVQLHEINYIHTDIKPDNILLTTKMTDEQIEKWLQTVPDDGKSHPLPDGFRPECSAHEAELVSVVLADLGQAQRAGQQPTVGQFSAISLRAPECILHSDFGPKVDIWAIGCIAFELLTGRWLFHPEDGGEDWTLEDDHLAKMLELTGDRFSEAMLQRAGPRRDHYFDTEGKLQRIPDLCPVSIEEALANYNTLPTEEVKPAAEFIRFCCRLDSTTRPTARQVEMHPWLGRAYEC